jgi:hypothetical protein
MPIPIGLKRVSCSAHAGAAGRQCRSWKKLTPVLINTQPSQGGLLNLPPHVVIMLCDKHFKFRSEVNAEEKP